MIMQACLAVKRLAVSGNLLALEHPVVADDARDPQAIVLEDTGSPPGLRTPVLLERAPLCHGSLVPKERQRENLARLVQALEPFDGDEPVDLIQQGPKPRCEIQILLLTSLRRPDLENDGNHLASPCCSA